MRVSALVLLLAAAANLNVQKARADSTVVGCIEYGNVVLTGSSSSMPCKQCDSANGYTLNDQKTCTFKGTPDCSTVEHCATCNLVEGSDSETTCTQCAHGFLRQIDGETQVVTCADCSTLFTNCESCSYDATNEASCDGGCSSGYTWASATKTCELDREIADCTKVSENCYSCDYTSVSDDTILCDACHGNEGFIAVDGMCKTCSSIVANCVTCDDSVDSNGLANCSLCATDYELQDDKTCKKKVVSVPDVELDVDTDVSSNTDTSSISTNTSPGQTTNSDSDSAATGVTLSVAFAGCAVTVAVAAVM